jgi:amino acid transporter
MSEVKRQLSVFDSTAVIVGIIIGVGIYETSPAVANSLGSSGAILAVWLAGGVLALAGGLCYAELATAYPRAGGDYVYLTRAFGSGPGFLFAWAHLSIVRPGDIALMVFIFGRYACTLYMPVENPEVSQAIYAVGGVLVLTAINMINVKAGKGAQNTLTVIKALGLAAIVVAGFMAPSTPVAQLAPPAGGGLALALILVLFTYGGWSEIGFIAAEVKDPKRNIVRAVVFGTAGVTVLYLAVNAAFLHALGHGGMAASEAVATDTVARVLPDSAARLISMLICISALGACNGMILTGARVSYAMGRDHYAFRFLGEWQEEAGAPARALLVQGVIAVAIIIGLGSFMDTLLYAAPAVWLFFLGTGCALFVLRRKDADTERPFQVPLYPVVPAVFIGFCLFMLWNCATYAWHVKAKGLATMIVALAIGVVVYLLTSNKRAERGVDGDHQ